MFPNSARPAILQNAVDVPASLTVASERGRVRKTQVTEAAVVRAGGVGGRAGRKDGHVIWWTAE